MKRISEWFRRTIRQLDAAVHYWEQDPLEQLEQRIRQLEAAGKARRHSEHTDLP